MLKASIGTKLMPDQLRIRELERNLAIAREERGILKSHRVVCESVEVRYAMVDSLKPMHQLQIYVIRLMSR